MELVIGIVFVAFVYWLVTCDRVAPLTGFKSTAAQRAAAKALYEKHPYETPNQRAERHRRMR